MFFRHIIIKGNIILCHTVMCILGPAWCDGSRGRSWNTRSDGTARTKGHRETPLSINKYHAESSHLKDDFKDTPVLLHWEQSMGAWKIHWENRNTSSSCQSFLQSCVCEELVLKSEKMIFKSLKYRNCDVISGKYGNIKACSKQHVKEALWNSALCWKLLVS